MDFEAIGIVAALLAAVWFIDELVGGKTPKDS